MRELGKNILALLALSSLLRYSSLAEYEVTSDWDSRYAPSPSLGAASFNRPFTLAASLRSGQVVITSLSTELSGL
ncbi:hypothetical protein B0T16DRAFT_403273 [Cercophora newfieldiana]|uniref:Uncharacterized protein n=1 Tax=Cercophora newfieldiana TaxID=92897 RepID=A0AA40CUH3_9PEZI|nr:hypothetical protein B0T16DRAFT_403273 [Cercophora newfieldiana]